MTERVSFKTMRDSYAWLDSLGGYDNPEKVAALKGAASHEVAVGPVHAGVIEPGHFRFQCMGEDVYNLQIFLGYQHRGVEDAIVSARGNIYRQIALAETCAGDTSAAAATARRRLPPHSSMYARASSMDMSMTKLGELDCSRRVRARARVWSSS